MTKNTPRLLAALLLLCGLVSVAQARWPAAEPPSPDHYKAALVYDYDSGQVIYQDRAHERVDPASLVKMMVVLVTMERVEKGTITLQDRVTVSRAASKIGGHQVYLKQGETFPLHELLRAVVIASANDASFAVAERVAGSQEAFVALMNARARELGMNDTQFMNAHGLPPDRRRGQQANSTSAYDLALLSRELMKFPQVREWAATRVSSFRKGKLILVNTNRRFLQSFKGADGFKTGYHPRGAGFCVVATAQREGHRLVAVLLGAGSSRQRLGAVTHLLERGFAGTLTQRTDNTLLLGVPALAASSLPPGAAALVPPP